MRKLVVPFVVTAVIGCGRESPTKVTPSQAPPAADGGTAATADAAVAADAGAASGAVDAGRGGATDAGAVATDAGAGATDAGRLDAALADLLPPSDAATPPHDAGRPPRKPDIGEILRTCPQSDPAYAQIRADFQLRSNGVVVGDVPCTTPPSEMPLDQYSEELITLQALRAIYYMDFSAAPPPWTNGASLYDWMKSKIGGIDLFDRTSRVAGYCCEQFDGRTFIAIGRGDDLNRNADRRWNGISGRISLYAHETRHVDGFPHVACCPSTSCDQTYDEKNLSSYGVMYWLEAKWLTGEAYVGYSCLPPLEVQQTANSELTWCNSIGYLFCDTKPPLVTMPAEPGGICR